MQRNYVNAGGLFFFSDQVSQGFIDDTLASNLSFQLMASKPDEHGKFVVGEAWRERYLRALGQYGYGLRRNVRQSIAVTGHESVWELVRQGLGQYVSIALLEQGHRSLVRLHDGGDDEALKLFRAYTISPLTVEAGAGLPRVVEDPTVEEPRSAVALQLAFIDAKPVMTQLFLSFQTASPAGLLPFVQLIDQALIIGNLEMRVLTTELDEQRYAFFRGVFLDKLGQRRGELIKELREDVP